MPSERGRARPEPPRWIEQPYASDFAGPERLALEAASGEQGDGLAGVTRPHSRLMHALDLVYGVDQWAGELAKYPRWPGRWMPGRSYDPYAYKEMPDRPPEWLRRAVEAHQDAQDTRLRAQLEGNMGPDAADRMLRRMGVPPAGGATL